MDSFLFIAGNLMQNSTS